MGTSGLENRSGLRPGFDSYILRHRELSRGQVPAASLLNWNPLSWAWFDPTALCNAA